MKLTLKEKPTKREQEILAFLKEYKKKMGYPAGFKAVREYLDCSRENTRIHLNNMVNKGLIKRPDTNIIIVL
jgi:SOS-response transcriptional repressor LexA